MDSLWGFKKGDIITTDDPESIFFEKKIKVKEIEAAEGENGKGILRVKAGNKKGEFCKPDNLILLERPGFLVKIGTKVEDRSVVGSKGHKGRVIVIDPFVSDSTIRFLVEFGEDWTGGVDVKEDWERPWYPQKHKTDKKNRSWFFEGIRS